MYVNTGLANPAYVTHPALAGSKRIRIEGIHDSDCELVMAMVQFKTGQVGIVVDNVEASFENLVKVHQLISLVRDEMDRRLQLHAQTVPGER
jgi:hypothetical protein